MKQKLAFLVLVCSATLSTYAQQKPQLAGMALRRSNWVTAPDKPDQQFYNDSTCNIVVINVKLSEINPQENVYDFSSIEKGLTLKTKIKDSSTRFKFRFTNGYPDWMKKFGWFIVPAGSYAQKGWAQDMDSFCIKWWTDDAINAYANIMQALSAQYDNDKRIAEVVFSAGSLGTAEPFNLAISDNGDGLAKKQAYLKAGLTDALRISALNNYITIMTCWKNTNISIALNPFEHLPTRMKTENNSSKSIGEFFCKTFTTRAILGNNGLRSPATDKDWQPGGKVYDLNVFYGLMHSKYGSSIYFQTASLNNMGGAQYLEDALNTGISWKARYIELPETESNLKKAISLKLITQYNKLLKAN